MAGVGGEINLHVRVKGGFRQQKNTLADVFHGSDKSATKRKLEKSGTGTKTSLHKASVRRVGAARKEREPPSPPSVMWLWWKACGEINFLETCHLLASFDPGWGGDWIDNSARAPAHSAPSRLWMSCEIISSTPPRPFFASSPGSSADWAGPHGHHGAR